LLTSTEFLFSWTVLSNSSQVVLINVLVHATKHLLHDISVFYMDSICIFVCDRVANFLVITMIGVFVSKFIIIVEASCVKHGFIIVFVV